MTSFCVLLASSPASPQAARGLQTALDPQSKGHVSIVLMQDAVLVALKDSNATDRVKQLVSNAGSAYVLADHLRKRGFSADDVVEVASILNYSQLVELMINEETSTIGVF